MTTGITPRVSPQYYLGKVRESLEKVELAFASMTYQSSYETSLHKDLKRTLDYLTGLERSLSKT